jgi:excisionase family DNA binding protein
MKLLNITGPRGVEQPSDVAVGSGPPYAASKMNRSALSQMARLTEIKSALVENRKKLPNQVILSIFTQEFIMSASQPSRFAPSPSQSLPRNEFVFEPLLDSGEAAELLRIHPKTLQRMARNRQIRGIQVGKLWRFRTSDLEVWLKGKRAG